MVDDNAGNQVRQNTVQNENVVAARAEGNSNRINGNMIRCYNYQGEDHYASNCTVKPKKQDAAYLQKQMQIAQKEEAWIQLTFEEFDFMDAAGACEETESDNANCTLENNMQQASIFGTQSDKAPVYDTDESAELSIEKSIISSLLEEKKKLKSDFKICEDELLDKQIQVENKTKELDNILVKTGQSIQTMHMLSPTADSFYHTEQKMALGYQNPFDLKQPQEKQQSLYNGKVLLEKHDPPVVHDSEETLQLAQETKFVRDFKSLAKEADESLAKHKALELEIKRLLRAVFSQDIMSIVQNPSVVDTSNLQTELERTKERFENCIIKKENEYAKLWNDWYRKCEECKYDKIAYDKAYNNMQQKIKLLPKLYVAIPLPKSMIFPKVGETRALSKPVTSNSIPIPTESKVVKNDNVISPRIFRTNPSKTSRPLSLSFDFVFMSEIFKSLSFSIDRLCHLAILCLDQHAHTLHHLESLLTISLVRLDILKEDLVYQSLQKSLSLIHELLIFLNFDAYNISVYFKHEHVVDSKNLLNRVSSLKRRQHGKSESDRYYLSD
nr:hypothetical protein [Tanacetum cinerariifolium]